MSDIERLKTLLSCAEIVRPYTKLQRSGKGYLGRCPFPEHPDKTPSFYVDDSHYKCFGCGRFGDCIKFVQEYKGIEFLDAVRELCKVAGIEFSSKPQKQEQMDGYAVLENTCAHYERELSKNTRAIEYLEARGINPRKYRLGWAGGLPDAPESVLTSAGLMVKGLAFFRNRIMFPIVHNGKVCGFGGRVLDDTQPKYLNSPQTEYFDKSKVLYSVLPISHKCTVLVEGYTDVLLLAEHGFSAVAPMGTSVTIGHLEYLWRKNPNPYIAFDGDLAGQRARFRLIELALPYLSSKRSFRFIVLPAGSDPADILRFHGAEKWQSYVDSAKELSDVLLEKLQGSPEEVNRVKQEIRDLVLKIQDSDLRDEYLNTLKLYKQSFKKQIKIIPTSRIRVLFGLLYKYKSLCKKFQEEIARLDLPPNWEHLRVMALRVAENEDPGEKWKEAENWCELDMSDPESVWRDIFIEVQRTNRDLSVPREEFLKNPTEDLWKKFVGSIES